MKRTPMRRTELVVKKPATEPKVRTRKCAVAACRAPFTPRSMTHKCCGPECAAAFAASERARADRADTRAKLEKLRSRSDHLKLAQASFNAFIRERDRDLPCISCGRFHTGAYDAGHYRSVGAMPALRFVEDNCHRQCVPCNQHKAGNIVEYRIRLIMRIGLAAVERLEQDYPPAKYTIEDAKRIRADYTAKLKELRASR